MGVGVYIILGIFILFLIGVFLYGVWQNLEGTKVKEWLRNR